MSIETSALVGLVGVLLAFLEIWKPGVALAIEQGIDRVIMYTTEYRSATIAILQRVVSNTKPILKDIEKGPQPTTSDQFMANQVAASERWKDIGIGYLAVGSYLILLKPAKLLMSFLNWLGKGKAVGGIGLVLSLVGLILPSCV
ncbi:MULTISPECIES: hypothetical protein [unclassified Halomonas]|uniref:hypothetical protein n=1 Tax=unclassified Halomonas TaxID=2609666 RepID=UPI002886EBEB|nr:MULTISPECIES: hypothetical protein [unclassified Halomonas]MDT0499526.1 hypothetical protein [Halomonas sp. PAR7]MDT0510657.1 hypothetical protein [Halomonas sp. LES1]MDT0592330.1 hypothetical protein [Halomonas sp. PAR8]